MTPKQRADRIASLQHEHQAEHRKVVEYGRLKRLAEIKTMQVQEELRRLDAEPIPYDGGDPARA